MTNSSKDIARRLAAPFDAAAVRWKPMKVQGNRALAAAYIDSRAVQDRLDEVLGVDGWQDDYQCLPDGSVVCRLRCRIGGEWLTKVDVGGPSEQHLPEPARPAHLAQPQFRPRADERAFALVGNPAWAVVDRTSARRPAGGGEVAADLPRRVRHAAARTGGRGHCGR
jgi:hypothetical protein